MIIKIETTSGIKVEAPTEKWVAALVCSLDPVRLAHLLRQLELRQDEDVVLVDVVRAILLTVAGTDPSRASSVFAMVNNKLDAYAVDPASVQRALTKW